MKLSESFNVETELVDDDGMFIDVAGYGVVHLSVFLTHLVIGVYENRAAALPKTELTIPHSTFGGDPAPKLSVRSANPMDLLGNYVSPMTTLETAIGIIDKAQRVYNMDGVTWERKFELIFDVLQTVQRLKDLGTPCDDALRSADRPNPKVALEFAMDLLQEKRNNLVRTLTRHDQLAATLSEGRDGTQT